MKPGQETAARKERLELELRQAELELDAMSRSLKSGDMRTQQAIAGQRGRVLGLRGELIQMQMVGKVGDTLQDLRMQWRETMLSIKEAEGSARAASKLAYEDELPALIARLDAVDEMEGEHQRLH